MSRNTPISRTSLGSGLLAAALFLGAPSLARNLDGLAEPGADYLFLDSSERAQAVQPLAGFPSDLGERVSYRAFNGNVYELTRFPGRYVEILLPDSWIGTEALSESQIRSFVDRSDLVYRQLMDLEGTEPGGDGPLVIAVIPDTCGWGCGLIGSKGLEIADIPRLNPILWAEIAADKGVGVLIHEMTHNFDVFWPYLYYLPGHAHAWTDFVTLYYFVYTREGQAGATPEEVAHDWLATTAPYFDDRTATWESCVRDGQCEARGITANNAWGGLGFRLSLLHGPASVRRFMAFLRQYRQTHEPPLTTGGKNDLYLEALAAGGRLNLGCVADTWRWSASKALRRRMARLYGAGNPECEDHDGDGFSRLTADCDDVHASIHPGAPEKRDAVDNDCDGRIDEAVWREPANGDFVSPRKITLPAEISGRITDAGDDDPFTFPMKSTGRVRFEICSRPDFQGWFFLDGPADGAQYIGQGQCVRAAWTLPSGESRFDVVLNAASHPGGYAVEAHPTSPWPAPPRVRTAPPQREGDHFLLTATVISPETLPSRPTAVRFWVNGRGIVRSVPYAPSVSIAWTPPAGADLERLAYRVQLLAQGVPLADFSAAQAFVGTGGN